MLCLDLMIQQVVEPTPSDADGRTKFRWVHGFASGWFKGAPGWGADQTESACWKWLREHVAPKYLHVGGPL